MFQVKPVHYIMTNVKSALHISPGVSAKALPKGLELQLEVTYHDNTGSIFAATRTDISVRASRADLVQMRRPSDNEQLMSNSSFYSNLVHSGDTVLRISDHLTPSQALDYIKLPIEDFIFPSKVSFNGDFIKISIIHCEIFLISYITLIPLTFCSQKLLLEISSAFQCLWHCLLGKWAIGRLTILRPFQ